MTEEQAFNLKMSSYQSRPNGQQYFSAFAEVIKHDGQDFGKSSMELEINKYEGARTITSLNFFPLRYHDEESAVRERLIARGRKFVALLEQPACREYTAANGVKEFERANGDSMPEKFNV